MTRLLFSIVEISLVSSVIIGLLLLLSPQLEKKYASKSLYAVWLVLALRLIVPFNLHPQQAVITIPTPVYNSISTGPAGAEASNAVTAPTHSASQPDGSRASTTVIRLNLTPKDAAALVWVSGASVYALVVLAGYLTLRRNIRRYARPANDRRLTDAFNQVRGSLGIKAGRVHLMEYPRGGSPMLTGFGRPVILLPCKAYDATELALIFRHELTHFQQKHLWFNLLLSLAKAVHWFNPLVWIMAREAGRQMENSCDCEVVKSQDIPARRKYGETILSAMARDSANHAGLSTYYHGGQKTMKQRLVNIFDLKDKKRGTSVVIAVALSVLISGTLVACSTVAGTTQSGGSPSTPAVSPTDEPVSPTPSADASDFASPTSDDETEAMNLVKAWAEAVQSRDGKAQYALYTKEYQNAVYDAYAGLNWVTGTSSPWIDGFVVDRTASGATVIFRYAASTGSAGSQSVRISIVKEASTLKISGISPAELILGDAPATPVAAAPNFDFLVSLIGMSKEDALKALDGHTPEAVDEGGLGFKELGIRVWFDATSYTKIAQVLIMSDAIDIEGLKLGDSFADFKAKFGEPVSDQGGDAHFKYGDKYLSVIHDASTDKVISVYILAEDF